MTFLAKVLIAVIAAVCIVVVIMFLAAVTRSAIAILEQSAASDPHLPTCSACSYMQAGNIGEEGASELNLLA